MLTTRPPKPLQDIREKKKKRKKEKKKRKKKNILWLLYGSPGFARLSWYEQCVGMERSWNTADSGERNYSLKNLLPGSELTSIDPYCTENTKSSPQDINLWGVS
jgi:hypothetical protein